MWVQLLYSALCFAISTRISWMPVWILSSQFDSATYCLQLIKRAISEWLICSGWNPVANKAFTTPNLLHHYLQLDLIPKSPRESWLSYRCWTYSIIFNGYGKFTILHSPLLSYMLTANSDSSFVSLLLQSPELPSIIIFKFTLLDIFIAILLWLHNSSRNLIWICDTNRFDQMCNISFVNMW